MHGNSVCNIQYKVTADTMSLSYRERVTLCHKYRLLDEGSEMICGSENPGNRVVLETGDYHHHRLRGISWQTPLPDTSSRRL